MSLFALPTTTADLVQLQDGLQFSSNQAQAAAQSASINAPGSTTSVFTTAASILNANISLSQVAMAVSALMEGVTIAVGDTTTPNTLTLLTTQFLPDQVANAIANHYDPTVYAAEALGLALASNTNFNTNFVSLNVSQFSQAVATATGVNVNAIQQFVANWTAFYTANPSAHPGLSVTQAAYGAAFGDATGVALLNDTTADLHTVFSTNTSDPTNTFSPNVVKGLVANALIDVATGQYATDVAIGALPAHTLLQGEFKSSPGGVFLTTGIDTPTSGFSNNPSGTPLLNGFTATDKDTVLNATPVVTPLGIAVNTLNTGDNLQTTGAATGATTLNDTIVALSIGANPPFATGVTMNGVSTANVTNNAAGIPGGFAGNITGLLVENNNSSVAPVTLGSTGQGLKTLLTDININGYGGAAGDDFNTVILAKAAADATKTINVSFTGGNLGTTAAGEAQEFAISDDVGGGTAASPNLTYGTWSLTVNNNANLQLEQSVTTGAGGTIVTEGGVGGATTLALAGAGNTALGQATAGDWQLLQKIDASAATGKEFITGATSGVGSQARASGANPGWFFGSDVGLLDEGAAGTFVLNSVLLGGGQTFLDVSRASKTQVAALTTAAGTGVTVDPGNEIIVKNSVATTTSADTFKNIAGFSDLGIGGPAAADGAGGTINLANLPTSINKLSYITAASADVTVNNQVNALTINTFDNGNGKALTVGKLGPAAGLADSVHLIAGNTFHTAPDAIGNVTLFGDELATLTSVGTATFTGTNTTGLISLHPTIGGNEQVTIDGDHNIAIGNSGGATGGAIVDLNAGGGLNTNNMIITITNTGVTTFHSSDASGSPLDLAPPGSNGTILVASTNAVTIDASHSGGLIMEGGDNNYTTSATVAGSVGDTFLGSTTGGNVLGGSIGNDLYTLGQVSNPETVYTGGGADTVTLAAGHTALDRVEFYSGFNTPGVAPGTVEIPRTSSITNSGDVPGLGWWGQATGGTATGIGAGGANYGSLVGNGTGTSADATTVTNFVTGATGDILDFGASSGTGHATIWGAGGANGLAGGTALGLVNGSFAAFAAGAGLDATIQQVNPGGTVAAGTNFIELTGQTFLSVGAVASALTTFVNYNINFTGAGLTTHESAHWLIGWQDTAGSTHIADLSLINPSGVVNATSTAGVFAADVHVSDIATLTGVSLTSLTAHNVHFV